MKGTSIVLGAAIAAAMGLAHADSPYAGQQGRAIKALSEAEVADLKKGAGMGFAKSAELNRYPGPMHVLEHASALSLTREQRAGVEAILMRHKAEARALGEDVVALEAELDALFASRSATAANVDAVLARLGAANARLRGSHLKAHLETTALLDTSQVQGYVKLRGYDGGAPAGHPRHSH